MRGQYGHTHTDHRMVVGAEHETGHRRLRKRQSRHPRGLEEHQRLRQTQQRHPRRLRHSRRGAAGILRIAPVRGQQPARAHHRQNRRLCRFLHARTWASVQLNGRVYGLPMDSGPMAFFYNNSVFEQVGVDASKIRTWDDYYEAAKNSRKSACTSPPIPATPASTTR